MTETIKQLTIRLKKTTQDHAFFGNNTKFALENISKTKVMQDEISSLRMLIRKESNGNKVNNIVKWNTTNKGRKSKR